MAPFQKPENALKRAQELREVGKSDLALDILHELITSRRHRSWSKVHEQIMIEYINLCTEMKKGRLAKEGLHQYKNITGSTALNSLEIVVNHYLKSAEDRVASARSELDRVVLDFDDLEASETPESLLLMMVSAEDSKDRTDRAVLTPWLKFLWEAYRTVLDILRNNSKLETLYQKTAQGALQFCLRYERKAEFRRLCDLLRYHLQQVLKYQAQPLAINLNAPESLQAHLETRFEQLNVASKLELWQEAFRAIEDISFLMETSNKSPRPQMLATYYAKLSMVFWRANQNVFHAQSLIKLFQLSKDQKRNFTQSEASALASAVLLAVLVCPLQAPSDIAASQVQVNEMGITEQLTDRNMRLSVLVGVDSVPTREGLIAELTSLNILQHVDPSLQELFALIEAQFLPLQLCKKVQPLLTALESNEKLAQYVEPLRDIIVLRLLKQLSQVYSSMKLSRLSQLIPFFTEFQIEHFILRSVKSRALQVRLCHRTRSISFATNVFVVESNESALEGPQLQSLQSQMMSNQLSTLSRRLREAVEMIDPEHTKQLVSARRAAVYENIGRKIKEEHHHMLGRKDLIEKFLENHELENQMRMEMEQKKREEQLAEAKRLEAERLEAEREEQQRKRREQEQEEINKAKALEKLENLKKSAAGARILADIKPEQLGTLDPDAITSQLEKEHREHVAKLKTLERKMDHFERAKHKEEIPIREEYLRKQAAERAEAHKQAQQAAREEAQARFTAYRELREKLLPVAPHKNAFVDMVMAKRRAIYEQQRSKVEEALRAQEAARQQELAAKEAEQARLRQEAEQARLRQEAEIKRPASDSAPSVGKWVPSSHRKATEEPSNSSATHEAPKSGEDPLSQNRSGSASWRSSRPAGDEPSSRPSWRSSRPAGDEPSGGSGGSGWRSSRPAGDEPPGGSGWRSSRPAGDEPSGGSGWRSSRAGGDEPSGGSGWRSSRPAGDEPSGGSGWRSSRPAGNEPSGGSGWRSSRPAGDEPSGGSGWRSSRAGGDEDSSSARPGGRWQGGQRTEDRLGGSGRDASESRFSKPAVDDAAARPAPSDGEGRWRRREPNESKPQGDGWRTVGSSK